MSNSVRSTLDYIERTLHTPIKQYQNGQFLGYWQHVPYTERFLKIETQLLAHFEKKHAPFPVIAFPDDHHLLAAVNEAKTTYLIGPIELATTSAAQQTLVNELDNVCETLCLLQNSMSDTALISTDILKLNHIHHDQLKKHDYQITKGLFDHQEAEFIHNPYDQEVRELQSITDGDLAKLHDSLHETFEGRFPVLGPTKLRSLKNLVIVDFALIARAAIKGGMDYEQAFSLNDQCICTLEQLTTISEIQAFALRVKEQYTTLVHEAHAMPDSQPNLLIKRCKRYIQTHLHDSLSLTQLAQYCHVSDQYLSKAFHQAQQRTLVTYIHTEKIQAAKRDLIYTNNKISAIAADYGFNSASHFGAIFKRFAGTTPTSFRKTYGRV